MRRFNIVLVASLTLTFLPSISGTVARASDPIVVNSASDPGDGTCDATECTLREAIDWANATPGMDTIDFAIEPGGEALISPSTDLPEITDPALIDGTSQAGYSGTPLIHLDGSGDSAGPASSTGLLVTGGSTTISALSVTNFHTGVSLFSDNNQLRASYIGLSPDGSPAHSSSAGVNTSGTNLIGGENPGDGNVISGQDMGLELGNSTLVEGNYIGTDPSGLIAEGNTSFGILMGGQFNVIGGTKPADRNVISGNNGYPGVFSQAAGIQASVADTNSVLGNYIGLGADGVTPIPNKIGVYLAGNVNRITVGGTAPGEANLIADNANQGVYVYGTDIGAGRIGVDNPIRGNSIYDNGAQGIYLVGGNRMQTFPTLTSAGQSATTTTVGGTLASTPSTTFTIDFYANTGCDGGGSVDTTVQATDSGFTLGYGEGETYIGTTTTTSDGAGDASFNVALPADSRGKFITATATDPVGNTSEFSQCIAGTVTQGDTVGWDFQGSSSQTVTDTTGMGLYDSGSQAPGSEWDFTFDGAGTYPYTDTLDPSLTGSVQVPLQVDPAAASGTRTSSSHVIRWATNAPPTGYRYDVQIKRPGAAWVFWQKGVKTTSAPFAPDAGKGLYRFRARLRRPLLKKWSGWSPTASLKG